MAVERAERARDPVTVNNAGFSVWPVIWIGITVLCLSFVTGTLVGLRYDDWMGIDIKCPSYRLWVAGAYWFLGPAFVITTLIYVCWWHSASTLKDDGPVFTFWCILLLWSGWGIASACSDWLETYTQRALNVICSAVIGWVVGLGGAAASRETWGEVCVPDSWLPWPCFVVTVVACAVLLFAGWRWLQRWKSLASATPLPSWVRLKHRLQELDEVEGGSWRRRNIEDAVNEALKEGKPSPAESAKVVPSGTSGMKGSGTKEPAPDEGGPEYYD